jgi:hypothetical protein
MGKIAYLDHRENLVKVLTDVLRRAQDGEIVALALAAQLVGDAALAALHIDPTRGNIFFLLGAIRSAEEQLLEGACEVVEMRSVDLGQKEKE